MTHVLAGMPADGVRVHHTTLDGMHLNTYELFIYGVFHFIFVDHALAVGTCSYGNVKPWIKGERCAWGCQTDRGLFLCGRLRFTATLTGGIVIPTPSARTRSVERECTIVSHT